MERLQSDPSGSNHARSRRTTPEQGEGEFRKSLEKELYEGTFMEDLQTEWL